MKKIIYTGADGQLFVVHPTEGARLASRITFSDGTKFPTQDEGYAPFPVDMVCRRWPVEGAVAEWAETEDEFVARIAAKDVPADAINPQIVDASVVPSDRTFRNAWKDGGGKGDHDMAKCKEIAHAKRRADRAAEFKPLDIEATIPAKAAQAEAKRQVIRNKYDAMQTAIDTASTPEELKALIGL